MRGSRNHRAPRWRPALLALWVLCGIGWGPPLAAQPRPEPPPTDSRPTPADPPASPASDRPYGGDRGGAGGGVGVGVQIDLGQVLRSLFGNRPDPAAQALAREGPRLPESYSFPSLRIEAVLRGGWPAVIAYELAPGASAELEFALPGEAPHRVFLPPGAQRGRTLITLDLPERFGEVLKVGTVSLRVEGGSGAAPLQLYGLGCGPLAIGSVAIDEVVFEPARLRLGTGERAFYGFHSRSDFSRAVVDIARLDAAPGGPRLVRVRSEPVQQSVARNSWVGREPPLHWNGADERGAASQGAHLLYVRAWAADPGDWVVAWSPRAVEVRR